MPTPQLASSNATRAITTPSRFHPRSEGALYRAYAAVGLITDIALEPGKGLTRAGPISAGDTARWITDDTASG